MLVDHFDSYLTLGPFKLEEQNLSPQVAIVHDFLNDKETDKIIDIVQGNMISTPYNVQGKVLSFSEERTSKLKYLQDQHFPNAMKISKRIEKITRLKLNSDIFASEDYQIMNYGIGGKISGHIDSNGVIYTSYDNEIAFKSKSGNTNEG